MPEHSLDRFISLGQTTVCDLASGLLRLPLEVYPWSHAITVQRSSLCAVPSLLKPVVQNASFWQWSLRLSGASMSIHHQTQVIHEGNLACWSLQRHLY